MEKNNYRAEYFYRNTDYPLYQASYWGTMRLSNAEDKEKMNMIFRARNKFAERYDIKNYANRKPQYLIDFIDSIDPKYKYLLDHEEIYRLKDGRILYLISPYTTYSDAHEFIDKYDFSLCNRLYNDQAISMCKIFDNYKPSNNSFDMYHCDKCNVSMYLISKKKHLLSQKHMNNLIT